MMIYKGIRPLLFLLPAEFVHERTLSFLKVPLFRFFFSKTCRYHHPSLNTSLGETRFKNPVGLAAGFDKSGELLDQVSCLGFGFMEVGTITPLPQEGNPKPRLFRLQEGKALLNRMGFNNFGVAEVKKRLEERSQRKIPIGINMGKNRNTSLEDAVLDYLLIFKELFEYGDYFAVNVSSPNTPNLRSLQKKGSLENLLSRLMEENQILAVKKGLQQKPLFVKISPDLSQSDLDDIVQVSMEKGITGLIATNSTTNHSYPEEGGLTGLPLRAMATEVIRSLYRKTEGKMVIIGVGGIASGEDAYEKILAGASLVQIYTGLIYEGPSLLKKINRELVEFLKRDGFQNIQEAVGKDSRQ